MTGVYWWCCVAMPLQALRLSHVGP